MIKEIENKVIGKGFSNIPKSVIDFIHKGIWGKDVAGYYGKGACAGCYADAHQKILKWYRENEKKGSIKFFEDRINNLSEMLLINENLNKFVVCSWIKERIENYQIELNKLK